MRTISVDFDGVLHGYQSGWQGAHFIPDPPVPGAFAWLYALVRTMNGPDLLKLDPVIFSSRSHMEGGVQAMQTWIHYWARKELSCEDPDYRANAIINHFKIDKFPKEKPPAFVSIDDRSIQFTGNFSALSPEMLLAFKPWNTK